MTRKRILIPLTVLIVLAVAAVALWRAGVLPFGKDAPDAQAAAADSADVETADAEKDKEEETVAVPVELAQVSRRAIAAYYKAASVMQADRLVDLVAKTRGRVQVLDVEEGDWVEKGRILAELDNDREKVQLRQAELKLEDERRRLERTRSMMEEGLISDQEFDVVRSAFELAETNRDLARITLEETRVRAPFAGQVTDRKIVLGQQVNAAAALFTLADFSPMRVKVYLPEEIALRVSPGQRVLITPDAVGRDLEARVERVAPVVDPATSTVRLTLLLEDGADMVRAGGFVKVRITTDTHNDALSIPKLALVEEGGLRSVFIAEADTVRKVEINAGLYDERYVEILDGVEEGTFVVVAGQGGLRTGSHFEALNAAVVGWASAIAADTLTIAGEDTQLAQSATQ
ncbi:efflux RND transporter periplasmic adaptor subunit [bacterium]|nr:efflux RND transporter periplasmic adaptor subunit [bacterium]MBU1072019.1 efflux RND transporter periplasmic adaptor subunit [bacterium]MBU1676252.1 efflux RND transporter periplasmic adaptor subunit [bacterium]